LSPPPPWNDLANRIPLIERGDPLRLAKEIDATLDKYGLGNKHHLFTSIKFFEDELRPIADCLRCAGPQKIAKQPRGSTDGVAAPQGHR
jgi:hypothetical protein